MFYDDPKLKNAVDQDADYEENNLEEEATKTQTVKNVQKRVTIEDPVEETPKLDFGFVTISIILSICAIAVSIFAKLLAISGALTAGVVFKWIAAGALIAGLAIYVVQVVKLKQVKFDPQLVLLILASVFFVL